MGLESWKKVYYNTEAKDEALMWASSTTKGFISTREMNIGLVRHALTKWEGIKPSALKEHGVVMNIGCIEEPPCSQDEQERDGVEIDYTTCTLCLVHAGKSCETCPIWDTKGDDCTDEYGEGVGEENPLPMIDLLKVTLAKLEDGE